MTTVNSTYVTCDNCGQYINVSTTDHVVCEEFGKVVHLHQQPCYRQYNDLHDTQCDKVVRNHQHLA